MDGRKRKHRIFPACALVACGLVVLACGSPAPVEIEPVTDPEADVGAVLAAHDAMVSAFGRSDADAFAAMLDGSSGFLLFHPMTESRYDLEELRSGSFEDMFAMLRDSHWTDVHLAVDVSGDAAWITSHVLIESPQLPMPFVGRGTEIWVRSESGWRLRHGHWSENPEDYP